MSDLKMPTIKKAQLVKFTKLIQFIHACRLAPCIKPEATTSGCGKGSLLLQSEIGFVGVLFPWTIRQVFWCSHCHVV